VDVFLDAVSHRGGQDPLHGVPFDLLLDKGSANTAHLFTNLAEQPKDTAIIPRNHRGTRQRAETTS